MSIVFRRSKGFPGQVCIEPLGSPVWYAAVNSVRFPLDACKHSVSTQQSSIESGNEAGNRQQSSIKSGNEAGNRQQSSIESGNEAGNRQQSSIKSGNEAGIRQQSSIKSGNEAGIRQHHIEPNTAYTASTRLKLAPIPLAVTYKGLRIDVQNGPAGAALNQNTIMFRMLKEATILATNITTHSPVGMPQ